MSTRQIKVLPFIDNNAELKSSFKSTYELESLETCAWSVKFK